MFRACFGKSILAFPSVSECKCNPEGSTTLQCDAIGACTCKDGFDGERCDDECPPNYFNYPPCQGLYKQSGFLKC